MGEVGKLSKFRFWCQKVLPLVYDDSLSYYELLCKVVDYLNKLIEDNKEITNELTELKGELNIIQEWINSFDYYHLEKNIISWLQKNLAKMIFVEISDDGYFIYFIPSNWDSIMFNTTGLDIDISNTEYGRLVLSY